MSNRRNPVADKAAANQQVIKSLLKLPGNKHCADCKRNAHPRWASWNLGIFVCIRCSGIHRGMGTHISRVKSVDLDTWTDEQLQSMLRWGNSRANKYWEAKLAVGHVPSESKIENFVRTKYESKRWVMEGGIPDPSTLADSDEDDTPLRVVQEKQKAEAAMSPPKPAPQVNLFDDGPPLASRQVQPPPQRQQTQAAPPPKPQQQKPADSLLGLDFFGGSPSTTPRPQESAASQMGGASSRPDLNRSILSLYSSAPKSQPKTQQSTNSASFGQYNSPTQQNNSMGGMGGMGGLDDAFGGLSFSTATPTAPVQPVKKASPFDSLTSGMKNTSGPGFSNRPQGQQSSASSFSNFGKAPVAQPSSSSAAFGDLFDLSPPAPSKPAPQPSYAPKPTASNTTNNMMSFDNAWGTPTPPAAQKPTSSSNFDWNTSSTSTQAKKAMVGGEDDFGAFSSSGFGAPSPVETKKPPVKYDDDLFNNVWG